MTFDDAIAEFLSYLEYEKGSAELTLVSYESDFKQFAAFLEEQDIPSRIDDVGTAVVRRYVAAMSKDGYARSTIGRRVASLRSLFKYLHQCEYLTRNPVAPVATPKTEEKLPVYRRRRSASDCLTPLMRTTSSCLPSETRLRWGR
jgi:integrase/recombinase XerC